ncbi:regulatory protein MsaA, partial [Staphylococcus aureus]|nr:regulatory protein MsaA [Staphylococcus aureus]
NNCDMNYCEDCEEDLQIFYSFIVLQNNEVYYKLPIID